MKKLISFWCIAIMILMAEAGAQAPDLSELDIVERSTPDGPVATVDGSPVSKDDFLTLYQSTIAGMQRQEGEISDPDRVRTGLRTLGELMQREILYNEAKRRKLTVSDAEVETAWKKKIERLSRQLTKPGQDPPTEAELLAEAEQTAGEARENVRKTLMVVKARDAVTVEQGISVPDEDIRKFYDARKELFQRPASIHIRQLFVRPAENMAKVGDEDWKKAEKKIRKALARIQAGENFVSVAKEVSDAADKEQGGDLGMVPAAQLPPFYIEALKTMKNGELSDIIRSEHGLHLIQLVDRADSEAVPFDKAKQRIRAVLMDVKTEDALNSFCEKIIDDPDRVRIYLQLEKTLAALGSELKPEAETR